MNQSEYNHAYYMANRQRLLPKHNEWNRSHSEETKEKYRERKEGGFAPRARLSEEEAKEHRRASQKKYRETHREEINAKARKKKEEHPEKIKEYCRKYYAGHRDEIRAKAKKYYARKKEAAALEKEAQGHTA